MQYAVSQNGDEERIPYELVNPDTQAKGFEMDGRVSVRFDEVGGRVTVGFITIPTSTAHFRSQFQGPQGENADDFIVERNVGARFDIKTKIKDLQQQRDGTSGGAKGGGAKGGEYDYPAKRDAAGRVVVKVPKMDVVRYLRRKAGVSYGVGMTVGEAAIHAMVGRGILFDIMEQVDAGDYVWAEDEFAVEGLFSGIKKAVKKAGKAIGKAAKVVTPALKKLGVAALSVGGVVAGAALGGPLIGTVAKFAGKFVGKAASAAAKLIGGKAPAEEPPAAVDPAQPAPAAEPSLYKVNDTVYCASNAINFKDVPKKEADLDTMKSGELKIGTMLKVLDIPKSDLGWWVKHSGGYVHQSILQSTPVPVEVANATAKPTSEEMNALTAQLAQQGQDNPDAAETANALATVRGLIGKTTEEAVNTLKKTVAPPDTELVTDGDRVNPGDTFMLDAWVGQPIGASIDASGAVKAKPGQKLEKGVVYTADQPLLIKDGKAVHANPVKRIITNKWFLIGSGAIVLLGATGTGIAIARKRKKSA